MQNDRQQDNLKTFRSLFGIICFFFFLFRLGSSCCYCLLLLLLQLSNHVELKCYDFVVPTIKRRLQWSKVQRGAEWSKTETSWTEKWTKKAMNEEAWTFLWHDLKPTKLDSFKMHELNKETAKYQQQQQQQTNNSSIVSIMPHAASRAWHHVSPAIQQCTIDGRQAS